MTDTNILLADVSNVTSTEDGTGSFDVLMNAIDIHLDKQYKKSRLKGVDYATVYLGAMQSAMGQALTFTLQEGAAEKQVDLLIEQIVQAREQTDLIIAQTAGAYEQTTASEADTQRKNILNNKQVLKIQKETSLIDKQALEVVAGTIRNDALSAQQILLLIKKVATECAQTELPTAGITKAQYDLTVRQEQAFKGKHLNDSLKLQLDAWSTAYAINDGDLPSLPNFMVDLNANSQLTSLDLLIIEGQDFMD